MTTTVKLRLTNEYTQKYVVYELNSVIGNSQYKTLEEVEFKGWRRNNFDTEDEAMQTLIDDQMIYVDYIIFRF